MFFEFVNAVHAPGETYACARARMRAHTYYFLQINQKALTKLNN